MNAAGPVVLYPLKEVAMKRIGVLVVLALSLCLHMEARAGGLNPFRTRHRRSGEENARDLIARMKATDPGMEKVMSRAAGWAVFPRIGKLGIGVGGAGGNGRVYRRGKFIGTTTMSQVSIGFQFGGQVYGEVILFQDDAALERFMSGKFEIGGNLSAVVFNVGAAETAGFKDGAMVFVVPDAGLMYEATISGQKFTFKAAK